MGLRRVELALSSSVNRLFAGAGVKNAPSGIGGVTWNQLSVQVWNLWDLPWGN